MIQAYRELTGGVGGQTVEANKAPPKLDFDRRLLPRFGVRAAGRLRGRERCRSDKLGRRGPGDRRLRHF
jgi:hypothetical protein